MSKPVLLYIITTNRHEAVSIAMALLEERLIACANISENVTSLYWWQGAIEQEKEAILIAKSQEHLVEQAIAKTKSLHSYECPCILTLPVEAGYPPYLAWATEQLRKP